MIETNRGSITIDGVGTYPGGEYDVVSISGKGTISTDLNCNRFSSSGSSKVCAEVQSEFLKSSVIVGPGCTIGAIEYSEELQIHAESVVEQYSKKEWEDNTHE